MTLTTADFKLYPIWAQRNYRLNVCMITAMHRTFLLIGGVLGFLGVALGAFAAHGLRSRLSPEMLQVFETGVRYQMYHALTLLIVAVAIGQMGAVRLLGVASWLFVGGIVLFSGSLYVLALTGVTVAGAVTPIGGLLFLAGWVCLAIGAYTK
jgi:uncharacterized membrane protein YgdD (TMEM256/DUF423 family)